MRAACPPARRPEIASAPADAARGLFLLDDRCERAGGSPRDRPNDPGNQAEGDPAIGRDAKRRADRAFRFHRDWAPRNLSRSERHQLLDLRGAMHYAPSAPNPKFAHTVRQTRSRTSGSKGALET